MNIDMHNEAQKQINEMEQSVVSGKHKRMSELKKAHDIAKNSGELLSEKIFADNISAFSKVNPQIDYLLLRRKAVAEQKFICPVCSTNQIQLVSWQHKIVDLRCRKCKNKFIWESSV